MERAERSKFSQKMSKETTLAINHATRVAIRKSSLKKVCIINFDPNNVPQRIPIPSVVRTMTASKIIYLYHEECREHCVEPLKEHTCFCLLEVSSTSKQKSLQGLDSTSTTGEEAYEVTASIVENVG